MHTRLFLVLGLLIFATLGAVGCSDDKTTVVTTGAPEQGIAVTSTGEAFGDPDIVRLTLGIQLQAGTIAEARTRAANAQQAVIDSLKRNGVDAKDIHTVQFTLSPVYNYRSNVAVLQGYQITNTVSVTVRKIDTAGQIIDDGVAAGGDSVIVQGISFDIEDPAALQKQARDRALKSAKEQAEQIASTTGVKLGSPISITENQASQPVVPLARTGAADAAAVQTPIEPGQLKVRISVNVVYRMTD